MTAGKTTTGRITTVKWIAYTGAGAAVLYLASWLPAVSFQLLFQREVLRHDPREGLGALLWARVAEAAGPPTAPPPAEPHPAGPRPAEAHPGGGAPPPGFSQVLHRGVLLPLPPGNLRRISVESETLVLEFDEGKLTVDHLPPGALAKLFLGEYEKIGGDGPECGGIDDQEALRLAASATPGQFHLGMSGEERRRYASALLTKILFWDSPAAAAESGREKAAGNAASPLSIALFPPRSGAGRGGFLSGEGAAARALVATPEGTFAFGIPAPCPPAWRREPARWGEIYPAPEAAAALWREEVRRRHPEGHALRVWAEGIGSGAPAAVPAAPTPGEESGTAPAPAPAAAAPAPKQESGTSPAAAAGEEVEERGAAPAAAPAPEQESDKGPAPSAGQEL